jgi:YVTN family beta-propeller protein
MEYRVLGPLEVLDENGQKLRLGGTRQQSVLASLLLRAGQTVALDRLVDELWEEPPATASRTVQAYVSRLRHELPAGAIQSRPGGYTFIADGAELDLDTFERRAEAGHAALAADEYERAASLLREALALWRGPALAGLKSTALRREAERLEELRLSVLEDRIEADLGSARHGEIVPELTALVAEHPLRERLRAQLMRALYRSGRPGDALALYREGRRLLVEELGMEPGQELRELEQAILRQDAELGRSDDGAGSPTVSGTVTFLFTDIEGSTQLLKTLGRARYGKVLAEHGSLLRAAFGEYNGEVIDTQGDAFFAAFRSAADAVSAAVAAQRALQGQEWEEGLSLAVRMGLHTGEAALADDRYLGLAVHLAARIGAAAHGGQVLLSGVTRSLVEDELPADVELRDLGEQRLKDIDRPVRLHQLGVAGLPVDFPPLRTGETAFAGREGELVTEAGAALRRKPRPRLMLVAAAGVIAAAVAIPLFVLGGGASRVDLGETPGNIVGVLDAGSGDVRAAVKLPAPPTAVAAGLGLVWAASADSNAVYAIDPETNTLLDRIPVEDAPAGIAVGGGYVWVTNSLARTVSQIDPQARDVLPPISVGNGPTGVAVGGGYVWVANTTDHTVSKIRASDGKLLKNYSPVADPGAVAVGEGAVWVASKSSGSVVKLNPGDGQRLDTIPVGQGPAAVAVGLGSVWVANSADGTVTRIDPETGSVRDTIPVDAGPSGIAIVRGEVWTANELAGTVSRIDPAAPDRATTVRLGSGSSAVAAGNGMVYVALRATGAAHRGGTLTVAVPAKPPTETLDLAVGSFGELWSRSLALTNDGLLTYRQVGGQAGNQLVPDLAVSMPDVADSGKTYTFQLQPSIRYSNGQLVRARDFRHAIERGFKLRARADPDADDLFRGIRGAGRCDRRRCNLAGGIVTDDAAGRVTFHLSDPDPYFLYKLTSTFAAAVPADTPLQEAKRQPLPATGPYRIESFIPNRSVRLVRNPRFREWSKAAQPAGFAEEILLKVVPACAPCGTTRHGGAEATARADAAAQKERIALVQQGKADLTSSAGSGAPFPVPTAFRFWVHRHSRLAAIYLTLNPNRPPFDDLRARRAVNYALDRNKVVQLVGGQDANRPTCQVLPPNLPGYRRYCPYTLPSAEGGWTAPDPAKATRLVAASRTAGAPVTLWVPRFAGIRLGRYLQGLLESLGYHVHLRSSFGGEKTPDPFFVYFTAAGALTHRGARTSPQIVYGGWIADYPAASNFIQPLFSCRLEQNFGQFCDRAFERRIGRAVKLEQTDPSGANRLWAELDREITDKALWVPLFNTYGADLVSKRVRNYQYNPQRGALLSQLWVR